MVQVYTSSLPEHHQSWFSSATWTPIHTDIWLLITNHQCYNIKQNTTCFFYEQTILVGLSFPFLSSYLNTIWAILGCWFYCLLGAFIGHVLGSCCWYPAVCTYFLVYVVVLFSNWNPCRLYNKVILLEDIWTTWNFSVLAVLWNTSIIWPFLLSNYLKHG